MRIFSVVLLILSCTYHEKSYHIQEHSGSVLNTIVRDLSFFPLNNERFQLSELKNIKAVVIIMRDRSCSIFERYGPQLSQLEKKYAKQGIKFIYNYTGQKQKEHNSKNDLIKHDFQSPYVIDSKHMTINALSANTSGDVFILTPDRRIIYRGPVDNKYHEIKSAFREKENYVSDVLEAIVLGKRVIPRELPVIKCPISRPLVKKKLFYSDVAPIIYKKCTVCHYPQGSGPIDYISYEDVVGRRTMFKYVIKNDLMPPWQLDPNTGPWNNDISLTLKEKTMLLKWIDAGCPRKPNAEDFLSSKESEIPRMTPDYVITLPETIRVPEGISEYKRFLIRTDFKQDKWIRNIKFILKPKVIHHTFLYILDPSSNLQDKELFSIRPNHKYVLSKISDGAIHFLSNDVGIKIPRKAVILWEIHYEPQGQKVNDKFTHIRVFFHKKQPKYQSIQFSLGTEDINIPPYQSNYKTMVSYSVKEDLYITSIGPHMHLRGKASSLIVLEPDGASKRIFGMGYFLWYFERRFTFKSPLLIKKGSVLQCINWFDNSKQNKWNPAPYKHVTYGSFREDEMSICFLTIAYPSEEYPPHLITKISHEQK